MKGFLTASFAASFAVALLVAAPTASAEVTQVQSIDTISVVGIGRVPISQTANPVEANTQYHLALVQAIGDGLAKAQMLAGAAHAGVGPIEAISEGGRKSIECKNAAGENTGSYKGAEPDSGVALPPTIAVQPAAPPRAVVVAVGRKHKTGKGKRKTHGRIGRRRHRVVARKAENGPVTCEITSELSLVYSLQVHG
ncbi:MAG TPA: hypothetical protein VMI13_12205 [Solirubrobacteraceae bacterium]|nr:hypothetical protein [Solirubrobacteraceae bacterium]